MKALFPKRCRGRGRREKTDDDITSLFVALWLSPENFAHPVENLLLGDHSIRGRATTSK